MARYTGPKCKLCRREKTKLFLKGPRCLSQKCAITRRNQPPGQHGSLTKNSKITDFGKHLREKQKVKRIYGVLEKQFRKYFEDASRKKGITGEILLQTLETRFDSILYNAGVAQSRSEARKRIVDGEFFVNAKKVNIPSYLISQKDTITFKKEVQAYKPKEEMPEWIHFDISKKNIKVLGFPKRDQINYEIKEDLIVEYYSR